MKRLVILISATAIALLLLSSSALAAPSGIFTGDETQEPCRHVDPVVSPGERSAHGHQFFGALGVTETETSDSLRAKPTAWDVATKHTGVWTPCVYENGVLLRQFSPHGILAYYKSVPGAECVAPDDMGGVTHEVGYRGQIGGGSFSALPPATSRDGALVLTLIFRGARDFGVACFPTVQVYIRLNVGAGPIGPITLGGPVAGVDGATGPGELHGDYLFGDDPAAFERFLAACVRPGIACGRNPTP